MFVGQVHPFNLSLSNTKEDKILSLFIGKRLKSSSFFIVSFKSIIRGSHFYKEITRGHYPFEDRKTNIQCCCLQEVYLKDSDMSLFK